MKRTYFLGRIDGSPKPASGGGGAPKAVIEGGLPKIKTITKGAHRRVCRWAPASTLVLLQDSP